jgi:hypothetical protein
MRLLCMLLGRHDPHRGVFGFRCKRCGLSGEDLHEMGTVDGGYVNPNSKAVRDASAKMFREYGGKHVGSDGR